MMSDIYISYSHNSTQEADEDLNFVVTVLKVELESKGYTVIIRDIDHLPGTSKIINLVDRSSTALLLTIPSNINHLLREHVSNICLLLSPN